MGTRRIQAVIPTIIRASLLRGVRLAMPVARTFMLLSSHSMEAVSPKGAKAALRVASQPPTKGGIASSSMERPESGFVLPDVLPSGVCEPSASHEMLRSNGNTNAALISLRLLNCIYQNVPYARFGACCQSCGRTLCCEPMGLSCSCDS